MRSKLNPAERTEEEFVGFKRDSILSCHLWRIGDCMPVSCSTCWINR